MTRIWRNIDGKAGVSGQTGAALEGKGERLGDLVLHVGFGRCATTTLQHAVLAKHPQVVLLGRPYKDPDTRVLLHRVMTEESLTYDGNELRSVITSARKALRQPRILVLSDENLVASRFDVGLIAERLRAACYPCRVVLTVREQRSWMRSYFLSGGGNARDEHGEKLGYRKCWRQWMSGYLRSRYSRTNQLAGLRYYSVASCYARAFGRENLTVLPFEKLRENPESWASDAARAFCLSEPEFKSLLTQKHEKKSPGPRMAALRAFHPAALASLPLKKWTNLPRLAWQCLRGDSNRSMSFAPWLPELRKLYAEDNRKLGEAFDLPLGKYGYLLD